MSLSYDVSLLDYLSEHMIFLSTTPSFWYSLNLSYDNGFHLSHCLGSPLHLLPQSLSSPVRHPSPLLLRCHHIVHRRHRHAKDCHCCRHYYHCVFHCRCCHCRCLAVAPSITVAVALPLRCPVPLPLVDCCRHCCHHCPHCCCCAIHCHCLSVDVVPSIPVAIIAVGCRCCRRDALAPSIAITVALPLRLPSPLPLQLPALPLPLLSQPCLPLPLLSLPLHCSCAFNCCCRHIAIALSIATVAS